MPKPRPPYLQKEITRHGKIIWYVRKRPNPRTRLPGAYGSPEFIAAYEAAICGTAPKQKQAPAQSGSLAWLIAQYRLSARWRAMSALTKRDRDYIFKLLIASAGDTPYKAITRRVIVAGRDRRADKPSVANRFLDVMRGLFRFALESEYCDFNPVDGVAKIKTNNPDGHKPWTQADIDTYQTFWPLGTKERVWLDVLLYTGLRRGDAVRLGRQHIKDGIAALKTEKSGFKVEVNLPILPVLKATLAAGPTGDLSLICGAKGGPLDKKTFGLMLVKAANKAGIFGKSAHGLRKAAAAQAAEAGATVSQLKALFGWTSDAMPSLYTRSADRKKMAVEAIEMLVRGNGK